MLAYLNGCFIPAEQLTWNIIADLQFLPIADAGFVFGATVTDLVRTFNGKLFRLDDHLARFRESCRLCRVPLTVSDSDLRAAAEQLTEHNAVSPVELRDEAGRAPEHSVNVGAESALVMLATPGPLGHYAGSAEKGPPTVMMHTFPLPFARYRPLFTDGAVLVVPPTRSMPAECVDPRAKVRSRMHWWIAEQQAKEVDSAASALLVDAAGHVTETAAANFLTVKDGTVLTPPRHTVLNGISLRVVEELCSELGIPFVEKPLKLAECQSADEAMVTCTSYCVASVRRLDGVELRWPGPVWRRLLAAWSERVGVDIERQFLQ